MGCTSVTGAGIGSAEKIGCKGSEHQRLGVNHLIGPHVCFTGQVTLSTGSATVDLPLLPGTASAYMVLANDVTAANAVKAVLTLTTTNTHIVFTGTASDVVNYAILVTGDAILPVNAGNGVAV